MTNLASQFQARGHIAGCFDFMATCYAFDALDIHPKNKKDVGERLARIALAKDYGTDVVYSGPDYSGITFENGKAIISFKHPEGGLVANAVPETYVLSLPKSSGSLGPQ